MQIKVSSTNPVKAGGKSLVRIYIDGERILELEIAKRSPVKYLRTLTRGKHLRAIEKAILPYGLDLYDIGIWER